MPLAELDAATIEGAVDSEVGLAMGSSSPSDSALLRIKRSRAFGVSKAFSAGHDCGGVPQDVLNFIGVDSDAAVPVAVVGQVCQLDSAGLSQGQLDELCVSHDGADSGSDDDRLYQTRRKRANVAPLVSSASLWRSCVLERSNDTASPPLPSQSVASAAGDRLNAVRVDDAGAEIVVAQEKHRVQNPTSPLQSKVLRKAPGAIERRLRGVASPVRRRGEEAYRRNRTRTAIASCVVDGDAEVGPAFWDEERPERRKVSFA